MDEQNLLDHQLSDQRTSRRAVGALGKVHHLSRMRNARPTIFVLTDSADRWCANECNGDRPSLCAQDKWSFDRLFGWPAAYMWRCAKRMVIVYHFVHTTNCRLAAFGLTGGTHGALRENAWRSPITPPTR
jgi:hypothetical protein